MADKKTHTLRAKKVENCFMNTFQLRLASSATGLFDVMYSIASVEGATEVSGPDEIDHFPTIDWPGIGSVVSPGPSLND